MIESDYVRPKVAVVYHYFASYREPILRQLCAQKFPEPSYELVAGIKKDKKNVGIRLIDPGLARAQAEECDLPLKILDNVWICGLFLWQRGLVRWVLRTNCDAIIFFGSMYFLSTWVCAVIAIARRKRVLMWTHGYLRSEDNLKGFIRKYFYKIADRIMLYNNRSKILMMDMGFRQEKLNVINNSLDYERQVQVRESADRSQILELRRKLFQYCEFPVLFFIGRLNKSKRLLMLLEAAASLHKQGQPVNVLFIGGGPEKDRLEEYSDAHCMKQYTFFTGPCHEEDKIGSYIMAADVCVSPGEVGLTAVHAMAYGKPVITHDNLSLQMPEHEAILVGETGSFYRYGEVGSLVQNIAYWIESERWVRARKSCIEMIEKHYTPIKQAALINQAVMQAVRGS